MPGGVTWKWLAATLLALLITVGGYNYKSTDTRNASALDKANIRITQLEVDLAQEKIRTEIQNKEMIRRLERIEKSVDSILEMLTRRRF